MTRAKQIRLPIRESYTVKSLMRDVMLIEATPSVLEKIGTEIIYFEWAYCHDNLGEENPITRGLEQLLKFMKEEYERQLLEGELWRVADTPRGAINTFLKTLPKEVLVYQLWRNAQYIHDVLEAAHLERLKEIERCQQMEKSIRAAIKDNPKDPDLYNQLRLTLWLLGKYNEASAAFKTAKKLGWDPKTSLLVAL